MECVGDSNVMSSLSISLTSSSSILTAMMSNERFARMVWALRSVDVLICMQGMREGGHYLLSSTICVLYPIYRIGLELNGRIESNSRFGKCVT